MTALPTSSPPITPEEFLAMPDDEAIAYELVDGQLVERNMGAESSLIAARIIVLLGSFLEDRPLGSVFTSETTYQCFVDAPKKLRRADVSFVRKDRLPDGRVPKGQFRIAPDLAVEVISPGDKSEEVDAKTLEWLGAGVSLLWVVSPATRTVRIHRPRASAAEPISFLTVEDTLVGEEVLPGFSCSVAEIFQGI